MSHFHTSFEVEIAAVRVRFGPGVRKQLVAEVDQLSCKRALVLSTPEQSDRALETAETLNSNSVGVFTKAAMHTPVDLTTEAVAHAKSVNADCVVSIGGGSTTGLGKAIAYQTDLPQIVIPTTYAGSEATAILGQTELGIKTTITDAKIQPEVILYDAELLTSLPSALTVTSGLNAIAHAAEALYARNRNPISTIMAIEGIRAFANALPKVVADPTDLNARGETLYGAWLCGTVLGQVGMALHHKLCHTLGGTFNLPHAETHAVLLPHTIAFNSRAEPETLAPICEILGGENAGLALYQFASALGAPQSLAPLGLKQSDLDKASIVATTKPYWNPQPVEQNSIRALLQTAFEGAPPTI